MTRPLFPPDYIKAPVSLTLARDLSDGEYRTYMQLRGMAWGKGIIETPPFSFEQFEQLTGTKKFTVYGHLRSLRDRGVLSWRSAGAATFIVSFHDELLVADCENPQLLIEGDSLINTDSGINPPMGGVGGIVENDNCENPQFDKPAYLERIEHAVERAFARQGADFSGYPEDVVAVLSEFCRLFGYRPPEKTRGKRGKFALWVQAGRDLNHACGEFGLEPLRKERARIEDYMREHKGIAPYTWSGPQSLVNTVASRAAEMRLNGQQPITINSDGSIYV